MNIGLHFYFLFLSCFKKALFHIEEKSSVLRGCCFPHGCQDIVQLLSLPLGIDVCPHFFLEGLRVHLSLETLSQPHGALLLYGEAAYLSDYVPQDLGAW